MASIFRVTSVILNGFISEYNSLLWDLIPVRSAAETVIAEGSVYTYLLV